jgi:hypothetical protein
MNIADLILALQNGQNPNAAIMAAAQAPDGGFPPAQPPGVDTAPVAPPAPPAAAGPPIPEPRPRPAEAPPGAVVSPPPATPAAPEGVKTPVTNPMPAEAAPRIIQSPPDLSNMYMELIKKNQNAQALDSGASLIAAGFSKYPEIRTGLIHGAFNKTGQHQLTSDDIVKLQGLQVKNQALGIRQAAKAGLMKQYGLSRDTVDYLDASDKLDEVIKAHQTQALQQVTNAQTGQVSLHHGITGKKIADVGGPKDQRTEDAKALDAVNQGRIAAGQPPIDMETFITTVKRDQPQQPNATDIAALDQINRERVGAGQPPTTMEEYVKTIKRDQRAAANEADVLALAAINKERPADKQMTMEHYLTKVKRTGTTVNVGPQGQTFPAPKQGFDYKRNDDGTVYVNPDTKQPEVYPIVGGTGADEATKTGAEARKLTREEREAEEKKNKTAWAKIATTSNVIGATDRALELVNKLGVTGTLAPASRALSFIGGKPSDSYDAQLSTIDANTALAELKAMRESSQTGASGLGSVTDFEQRMLASTINNLRSAQQSADAEKGLIRVKAMFKTMMENRFDEKVDKDSPAKFQELLDRNIHEITIEHTNKNKSGTRAPSNIRRID